MPDSEAAGRDSPAADPKAIRSLSDRSIGLCSQSQSRWAGLLHCSAPLVWIPQAAALAGSVQQIAAGQTWRAVLTLVLTFALLGLVRASLEAWASRRAFQVARRYVHDIRTEAVAALAQRAPLDGAAITSGAAASVIAEQAELLLPWQLRYEPARWRVMVVPGVIALTVGGLSWMAALVLLLTAPVMPVAMALIGWRAQAASEAHLGAIGGMNAFLMDRLRGLSTLRALGAVDRTARRVRDSSEDLRARTLRVLRIAFLSSAALELLASLAVAMVAVYVGFHLLGQLPFGSWGASLSLGQGLFILLMAPAFFEPLRELSAAWHDRAAGQAALAAIRSLVQPAKAAPSIPGAGQSPSGASAWSFRKGPPAVEVRGLRVGQGLDRASSRAVSFQVGAGERVALVGASGSGKSMLLATLAGLVPAAAGGLTIGDEAMTQVSAPALRRRMAWLGQAPHLFSQTVGDNVGLQRSAVSRDAINAALKKVGLVTPEGDISKRLLGEGGIGLSGGELRRVGVARAMVSPSADLWLVDEPTAHLDGATASAVIHALLEASDGRTLIVATHDPALMARLDRVIDLDRCSPLPGQADAAQKGPVANSEVLA
jgi:ATP-binding cassette, subfamily C, bacterial CydD